MLYDVSKFWFHLQTDLVLFSRNQNKHIMKISCGGGHRSYGFSSKQQVEIPTGNILRPLTMHVIHIQIVTNKSALAVYIKQSVLCLRKVDLHAYFTKPVLQVLGAAVIQCAC